MKITLPHDPATVDNVSVEQWLDGVRHQRDRLLAACDWTQHLDAPVDKAAWAAYRQALRDFPATWEPGAVADFPNPPDWVEPEAPASDDDAGEPSDAG